MSKLFALEVIFAIILTLISQLKFLLYNNRNFQATTTHTKRIQSTTTYTKRVQVWFFPTNSAKLFTHIWPCPFFKLRVFNSSGSFLYIHYRKLPFPKFFARPHFDMYIKFIEALNLATLSFFASTTYKSMYKEIRISSILIDD